MCGCLSHAPYWGPGLQPRHVPWAGIEPATRWFIGWHSIHWATPVRADSRNSLYNLDRLLSDICAVNTLSLVCSFISLYFLNLSIYKLCLELFFYFRISFIVLSRKLSLSEYHDLFFLKSFLTSIIRYIICFECRVSLGSVFIFFIITTYFYCVYLEPQNPF